ncbi:crotonase/enoyl-CoA hydratase family protein [Nocardioides hungaricus]
MSAVLVERRGAVQIITINRPEAKNALDRAVAVGIRDAVDELDSDDGLRAGVLTGAGGVFSAGMDLKAFLRGETPAIEGRGLCGMTRTPPTKPVVAAVSGWALAGGFELLLACDLIVADETARFGVPETQRALVAAGGAAILLASRIPRSIAMELILTGDPIDAARAAEIGLVNHVVPAGEALETALALATRIAANGPLAVTVSKHLVRESADLSTEDAWARQEVLVDPVFSSDDAKEGAAAFAERRPPVWTGR